MGEPTVPRSDPTQKLSLRSKRHPQCLKLYLTLTEARLLERAAYAATGGAYQVLCAPFPVREERVEFMTARAKLTDLVAEAEKQASENSEPQRRPAR